MIVCLATAASRPIARVLSRYFKLCGCSRKAPQVRLAPLRIVLAPTSIDLSQETIFLS